MKIFSADYLANLSQQARISPRLRQHRNIHQSYQDACQRLFNAIEPGSYIRPHRHALDPRDETLIAIRGSMAFFAFDDQGQITDALRIGGNLAAADYCAGVEVPPYMWHTVVALEPGSILLEIKAGPFNSGAPKEFAPWAPKESSVDVAEFLTMVVGQLDSRRLL